MAASRDAEGRPAPAMTGRWSSVPGKDLLYPGLMALLFVFLFRDVLFFGHIFRGTENILGVNIWKDFVYDSYRSGHLPMWTRYIFSGFPLWSEVASGWAYPPDWALVMLLSKKASFDVSTVLHLYLNFLFTYMFCRKICSSSEASLLGGIVYSLSGFVMGTLGGLWFLWPMPWLPLGLYFAETAVSGRKAWPMAAAAVAVGLSLSTGIAQVTFYTLIVLTVYLAWRLHTESRHRARPRYVKALLLSLVALAFGAALAAPTVLTTLQLIPFGERAGGVSLAFASIGSLNPLQLFTLVAPGLFLGRNGVLGIYAAPYIGIIPLFLILVALRGRDAQARFWGWLALALSLLAVGRYNPLFFLLYRVPGFNMFRQPYRWFLIITFALAIATARGFGLLFRTGSRPGDETGDRLAVMRSRFSLLFIAGGTALIFGLLAVSAFAPHKLEALQIMPLHVLVPGVMLLASGLYLRFLNRIDASGLLLVGLVLADLLLCSFAGRVFQFPAAADYRPPARIVRALRQDAGKPFRIYSTPIEMDRTKGPRYLSDKTMIEPYVKTLSPPVNMDYHLESWFGATYMDPVANRRLHGVIIGGAEGGNLPEMPSLMQNSGLFLGNLNVRYVITTLGLNLPYRQVIESQGIRVYRNTQERPRAYLAERIEVADEEGQIAALEGWDLSGDKVLVASAATAEKLSGRKLDASGELRLVRYEDDLVEFGVDAKGDCCLVLMDKWFPGWEATVDGRPVEISKVNFDFRAVPLDAGKHSVVFRYSSRPARLGFLLTLLSFVCLAAVTAVLSQVWRGDEPHLNEEEDSDG